MKCKLLIFVPLLFVVGCSSTPVYKVKGYDGPEAMHRNEVVQAAKECVRAKLKPSVEYTSQKVNTGGRVLVPVNVHCEPY